LCPTAAAPFSVVQATQALAIAEWGIRTRSIISLARRQTSLLPSAEKRHEQIQRRYCHEKKTSGDKPINLREPSNSQGHNAD
jgi:hypothetical protein